MPYNGSGTFTRAHNWTTDKTNTVPVTASRMDTECDGFATGLSTAICKDGQTTATARIPFVLGTSAMAGSASSASYAQVNDLNTGMYFPAADQVAITCGGTTVLTLTASAGTILGNPITNFPSGTLMLFQQTAAPTGWTKSATHDNKALRVVSGVASSGGTVAFTTAFSAFVLAQSQLPNVTLTVSGTIPSPTIGGVPATAVPNTTAATGVSAGAGVNVFTTANYATMDAQVLGGGVTSSINGNQAQASINLAVQFVDIIIASKD